jgi:hypothetical protein
MELGDIMIKFLSHLFAAALYTCALAQAQPASSDPVAETLIAKSKAVPEAVHAKDVKSLSALLADDFHMVASEGHLRDRGELLGAAEEGAFRDYMIYDPQVLRVDSDSSIVTYNLIVTMMEGDDVLVPRYQKVSDLWVRQGDDWRLKFQQATPLRPVD